MTNTPKRLRKINALSQNKNRKSYGDGKGQGSLLVKLARDR